MPSACTTTPVSYTHLDVYKRQVGYLACDGAFCGSVLISDEVKPTARQAMDSLHSQGVRTVMFTGDSKAVACLVYTSPPF